MAPGRNLERDLSRDGAYRLSPAVWAERELKPRIGIDLDQWQRRLVVAPRQPAMRADISPIRQIDRRGRCHRAFDDLSPRQHEPCHRADPAPVGRGGQEGRGRILIATGQKLTIDNIFELSCCGSRVVALPGSSDDTIRGLVDRRRVGRRRSGEGG